MFTPSIQSLSEAYQEVYEAQEGRRSPEERKARGKELGDRQKTRRRTLEGEPPKELEWADDEAWNVTKEEVIGYLMDEGYVNNEVSAEIFIEHMSDGWLDDIIEGYKKLPVGKMMKKTFKKGMKAAAADELGDTEGWEKNERQGEKITSVASDHDAQASKKKSDENRKRTKAKPFDGHPARPWPSYGS